MVVCGLLFGGFTLPPLAGGLYFHATIYRTYNFSTFFCYYDEVTSTAMFPITMRS